jgi:hypothetical protein
MSLLFALPESKLQPLPSRCLAQGHRPFITGKAVPGISPISANAADLSLLKQHPARRAAAGTPLPPHLDWSLEMKSSPLKFSSMSSPVPRFEEAPTAASPDRIMPGIRDWTRASDSCFTYRSVFTGPPRFPAVQRDITTPLQQQSTEQIHDRRSCTAQHKEEREPNLMLQARVSAALAKESQAPSTTERMALKSVQDRAAALEVDQIGYFYGAKDHERIRNKQDRLMEVSSRHILAFALRF